MTPRGLPLLAQRLFNRPLVILPDKAEIIVAALADRLGVTHLFRDGVARPMAWDDDEGWSSPRRPPSPFDVVEGVALIEVTGTLVHKLGSIRPYSGMTGYDGIRAAFLTALATPDVRAIVLDIDSPGGEVAGCFDLVDTIAAARGVKPIWAILSENACSGAYAIAAAADRISVPRTGSTGSIGVITMHVDWSKAMASDGVSVTLLTYGDRKADGNMYEPLADQARVAIQADLDAMGELFVSSVAAHRRLPPEIVRGQQAAVYLGAAGVAAGLADVVAAPDEAFGQLLNILEYTP